MRKETFEWLKSHFLAVFYFKIGILEKSPFGMAVVPANVGFFAMGLAKLQTIVKLEDVDAAEISAVIYAVPPFRNTHFNGKHVVVHHRKDDGYENISYNLYPGPSAKKGICQFLLSLG